MSEAKTVQQLIALVSAEVAAEGISKDRQNPQQGYRFRGIDDVYNALAPILAKAGLIIVPRFMKRDVTERESSKGGKLFYVTVEAEFDFVSSFDNSTLTARTFGEAMDSGDKATNKAMSAAYKYACFQIFCIPTEGENDSENETHRVESRQTTPPPAAVLQHPSSKPPAVVAPSAHTSTVRPTGQVLIKDVKLAKQSKPDASRAWKLWAILFESKVRASDGEMVGTAYTFTDSLAEAAENFKAQERPVLPVITPNEKQRGSYDLQSLDLMQ